MYYKLFNRHLIVQSQQWKQQNNVWNLFNISNKDTRTTSCTGLFIVNLEQISHIVLVLTLLTLKKQMLTELCDTWGFFIFDDCILFPLFVSFRINNTDYHQEKLL